MKLSENGIYSLINWEGFIKKGDLHLPYDDDNGKILTEWVKGATIGYGHLITSRELFEVYKDGITDEEALEIKRQDIIEFERIVNNRLNYRKLNMSQHQFDALVIQCFNTPKGNLNVIKSIEKNELTEQVWLDNFSTDNGKFVQGLENRRKKEWKLFSEGVYHLNA